MFSATVFGLVTVFSIVFANSILRVLRKVGGVGVVKFGDVPLVHTFTVSISNCLTGEGSFGLVIGTTSGVTDDALLGFLSCSCCT